MKKILALLFLAPLIITTFVKPQASTINNEAISYLKEIDAFYERLATQSNGVLNVVRERGASPEGLLIGMYRNPEIDTTQSKNVLLFYDLESPKFNEHNKKLLITIDTFFKNLAQTSTNIRLIRFAGTYFNKNETIASYDNPQFIRKKPRPGGPLNVVYVQYINREDVQ